MRIYPDAAQAAEGCALQFAEWLVEALDARGRASVAVSGGSTPRLMLAVLARAGLDWSRIQLFQVDERGVPPGHAQSNYKMIRECFLEPAGFPEQNAHRMFGELDAAEAAACYAAEIGQVLGAEPFDVVQCGMGADGHTASLFPGDPLALDTRGVVAGLWAEDKQQWRITLLPKPILAARHLCALATGADKAPAFGRALRGPADLLATPAQLLRGAEWFVDEPLFSSAV